MGRPRKTPPPDAVEILHKLGAEKGALETHAAKALGVGFEVWQRWREEIPEIKTAWEHARRLEHDWLVDTVREQASQGNLAAAFFMLKARYGYRDGGPNQVDPESATDKAKTIKTTITKMKETVESA